MTLHERIVADLCRRHGAETMRFNQAVANLLAAQVPVGDRDHEGEAILRLVRGPNVVPDCHWVGMRLGADGDSVPLVRAWEVVITVRLTPSRLARYQSLSSILDNEGAAFVLIEVDRHGQETTIMDEGSWVARVAAG